MAQSNKISLPGAFGGLMRYDEEYPSKIMITPTQVIGFIVLVVFLIIILKIVWPVV